MMSSGNASGCRSSHNARMRLACIESVLSLSTGVTTSSKSVELYAELVEIQKFDYIDESTRDACWSLILREMCKGRVEGIAHALANYELEDIRAFFDDLQIRRFNWKEYLREDIKTVPCCCSLGQACTAPHYGDILTERFYAMLAAVICDLQADLNVNQAIAIVNLDRRMTPLALLFMRPPPSKPKGPSLNFTLFLTFLAHNCYTPSYNLIPFQQSDFQWPVKGALELFCKNPTDDLIRLIAHILRAIQPLANPDPREEDITRIRTILPWLPPWSPRKYLARHPASPFLCFTAFLANRSAPASRLLVEGGLIRTLEALYDQDFPDPRVREDDPYLQTRDELYELCLRVLDAVSRHCDLRDCVLMEELKADLRRCSRELSEQYFGVFWTD